MTRPTLGIAQNVPLQGPSRSLMNDKPVFFITFERRRDASGSQDRCATAWNHRRKIPRSSASKCSSRAIYHGESCTVSCHCCHTSSKVRCVECRSTLIWMRRHRPSFAWASGLMYSKFNAANIGASGLVDSRSNAERRRTESRSRPSHRGDNDRCRTRGQRGSERVSLELT